MIGMPAGAKYQLRGGSKFFFLVTLCETKNNIQAFCAYSQSKCLLTLFSYTNIHTYILNIYVIVGETIYKEEKFDFFVPIPNIL